MYRGRMSSSNSDHDVAMMVMDILVMNMWSRALGKLVA